MPIGSPPLSEVLGAQRLVSGRVPAPSRPRRRRTLGLCAHCHRPVEVGDEHLRLYRRAWHLQCALAAEEPLPGRFI